MVKRYTTSICISVHPIWWGKPIHKKLSSGKVSSNFVSDIIETSKLFLTRSFKLSNLLRKELMLMLLETKLVLEVKLLFDLELFLQVEVLIWSRIAIRIRITNLIS